MSTLQMCLHVEAVLVGDKAVAVSLVLVEV